MYLISSLLINLRMNYHNIKQAISPKSWLLDFTLVSGSSDQAELVLTSPTRETMRIWQGTKACLLWLTASTRHTVKQQDEHQFTYLDKTSVKQLFLTAACHDMQQRQLRMLQH